MKTFALIFSGLIVGLVIWHIIYTNSKKEPKKEEPTPPSGSGPKPKVVPHPIVGVTIPTEAPDEYTATARVIITNKPSIAKADTIVSLYPKNKALETLYADYLATALKPSKTYNEWFVWKFGKDNKNPLLSMYQEYVTLTPAPYKKYEEWFSGLFGDTNRDTGDYCQNSDGVDGKWQGTGGNSGYCRVNAAS